MMKIKLIIIALLLGILVNAEYYIIYDKSSIAGYYKIDTDQFETHEYALWIDGFSKEYAECSHNEFPDYSYKSYSYYSDNQLPKITEYKSGKLKKDINRISAIYSIERCDIVFSALLPMYALMQSEKTKINVINAGTGKAALLNGNTLDNINFRIFGNSPYPDSVYFHNYRFIKTDKVLSISNPYSISKNNMLTPSDFVKKANHIKVNAKRFKGEFAYNKNSNTVVMILPFDQFSNRYGNTPPLIMPYTNYQISEGINVPSFIFEFNEYKEPDFEYMKQAVIDAYKYLNMRYENIIVITFGPMLPLFISTGIERPVIAVNPPFEPYEQYAQKLFEKLKGRYIFSSWEVYSNYDPLMKALCSMDLPKAYRNSDIQYIISKKTMPDGFMKFKNSKAAYSLINNVDTRLNSYIVNEDFWSYRKRPRIHSKVIDHINKLIDNISKRRGL